MRDLYKTNSKEYQETYVLFVLFCFIKLNFIISFDLGVILSRRLAIFGYLYTYLLAQRFIFGWLLSLCELEFTIMTKLAYVALLTFASACMVSFDNL